MLCCIKTAAIWVAIYSSSEPQDWHYASERLKDWLLMASKNPPANVGDTRDKVSIPGSGRIPGEEKATRCNILTWKIPWKEGPSGLKPMGWQRVRHDWAHTCTQWTNSTAAEAAFCRPHQNTSSPGWYIPTAKHNIQSMVFAQQMWTAF